MRQMYSSICYACMNVNNFFLQKLPRVNRMLAEKLVEQEENPAPGKKGKKVRLGGVG